MYLMHDYDSALQHILDYGIEKKDRTGVGCISCAGLQSTYRLDTEYFPIVTRRQVFPKSIFAELIWFLRGNTMNQELEALGAKFWGKWCDENNPKYVALREKWGYDPGDFGPIYGWQLRHFGADYIHYRTLKRQLERIRANGKYLITNPDNGDVIAEQTVESVSRIIDDCLSYGFDQLAYMMDVLKSDPFGSNGRRCLFSLWNPNDLNMMALPPCHYTYQAVPNGDGTLTGIMTQRSCDFPIGVPANVQFYGALTIMLAQQCGMQAKELIHNTNDSHIYLDQVELVKEYLSRPTPPSPKLIIHPAKDIYSYEVSDFVIEGYEPLDRMNIPVAV